MSKSAKALCLFLIVLGSVNFITFLFLNQRGGAPSPYPFQGFSIFITHPLLLGGMFYLLINEYFPKMIFRGKLEDRNRKSEEIKESGVAKAYFTCAGRIGSLNLSGPLLKVTVYPRGLVCEPLFMSAFGISQSEIQSLTVETSFLKKGVQVVHNSPEVVSPIFFFCLNDEAATSALTSLKP